MEKFIENLSKVNLSDRFVHFAACLEAFCPRKTALRISSVYVAIGALWILLSDKILHGILADKQWIATISMLKGWAYVLATGILLFWMTLKALDRLRSINQALLKNYEELAAVYEELAASEQELQKHMEVLEESEERYRLVSEATNDGIWDEKHGKRIFSERWHEIMGYTREELEEIKDWMTLIHPEDIEKVVQRLAWNKQNRETNYICEYRLKHKSGSYRWILSRAKLIFDSQGEIIRSVGSHTDITDLKKYQDRLKQHAFKDFLTNLPNRRVFYQTVRRELIQHPERKMALMFIDVDNFKYINDSIGHPSGDILIAEIGKRLAALADDRKSVYRLGGDEFVIFVNQYEDKGEVEKIAEEILRCFKPPFELSGFMLNLTVSIGIALYPIHGNDSDMLFKCADMAMYKVKSTLRGRYVFYDADMARQVEERMMLENELRNALDKNEFDIYYQPQYNVATGEICSFEALLRWKNERLGLVSPDKFVRIAEETHLINLIGDWVAENSCKFLKTLHEHGYSGIGISVNVSIIQLMQRDFVGKVMEILARTGVAPQYLELEVTESVFIESYDEIKNKLEDLISKGIKVALDDFGKGYSSLSYLTQIPITTLKIDKSFVDTICSGRVDRSLTSMIIKIGRRLGLSVVAEGVETEEQLGYLKKHKCQRVQGYYFSRPLPQEEAFELLDKNKELAVSSTGN